MLISTYSDNNLFDGNNEVVADNNVDKFLSISEYNNLVNNLLCEVILKISGEVTEINNWQNKYTYITLKDTGVATVTTSVFGITTKLAPNIHKIKNGDIVILEGRPGIHSKTGRHSFQAESISKIEEGTYEKRRADLILKLTQEGLLDPSKKRPIKRIYNRVALITAVPSQAYNDFIKIYNNRWGFGSIDIYKSQMQGENSYKTIIENLQKVNVGQIKYDVVVIARGGGSKEDLISFDSEELVRMLFACKYPTVSAIGHEGDISICDLVADLRASTPSNAAELITTPDKSYYIKDSDETIKNIYENINNNIDVKIEFINDILENIKSIVLRNIEILERENTSMIQLLDAYDINNTLKRGFSIITNEEDKPITEHNNIEDNNLYNIYLKNGKKQKYKISKQS